MNLVDESQIMVIVDNNPNRLPTILAILVVIYIIYAILCLRYYKKKQKKLKRIKELITFRHEQMLSANERRERLAQRKKSGDRFRH